MGDGDAEVLRLGESQVKKKRTKGGFFGCGLLLSHHGLCTTSKNRDGDGGIDGDRTNARGRRSSAARRARGDEQVQEYTRAGCSVKGDPDDRLPEVPEER